MRQLLSLFCLVVLFASCEKSDDPAKKVVLDGYIYAGEPIDDIRLTKLIPFGGEDSTAEPINDALVFIDWRGTKYPLVPAGGDSGFYKYPGTDLQILEGESYRIEFDYFGRDTYAETSIPPAPRNFSLDSDSIRFEAIEIDLGFFVFRDTLSLDKVNVRWDNPAQDYFYLTVENIESEKRRISQGGLFGGGGFDFRVFSEPFQTDEYIIRSNDVTHYGKHIVNLYRINQEYLDLYETRVQDSRNLQEPLTNVVNGLGVFAGFNGQSDTIYVVLK